MTDSDQPPVESVEGRAAYDVPFVEDSSHGHVVALLVEHAAPGLIVDIGCGYAPHAAPLRERGFEYVGVDADEAAVASLRERGFTAGLADADDPRALIAALDDAVAQTAPAGDDVGTTSGTEGQVPGSRISAVLALDVLEHLVSPHLTLAAVVDWMRARSVPVLGLSLPNVSHQDVALKLLTGRFDLTPTGLLDHTHLRFFTDRSVAELSRRVGVEEIARHDVRSPKSDQDWPEQHPMLSDGALLGTFLRRARAQGDAHGTTFQFVRLFTPTVAVEPGHGADDAIGPTLLADRPAPPARSITVLARPGTSAEDLEALRRQVDEQTPGTASFRALGADDDPAEILDGITTAYVTVVGAGDRLSPQWASSVLAVADRYPAAAVRSGPLDGAWADRFSPFDHYVDDATPGAAVAFPTAFLREVSRIGVGGPDDVDTHALLLEASTVCGVVDSGVGTIAVQPGWAKPTAAVDATVERLAGGALLAPVGAAREIARLRRAEIELVTTRAELDRRHAEIDQLNAELARRPVRVVRRASNLVNRLLRRG